MDEFSNLNIVLQQDKISQDSTIPIGIEGTVIDYNYSDIATIIPSKYQLSAKMAANDSNIVSYGSSEIINIKYTANCGYLTPDITYTASIIKGSEYGKLVDIDRSISADTISGIERSWGTGIIEFDADETEPEETDTVIIQISTSEPSIKPYNFEFVITPSPLHVEFSPNTLSPGDTADIIIKKKNPDGTLADFSTDQTFEIGVLDGCDLGDILVGDSLSSYFNNVEQPIKLVTNFLADSGIVKLRVGLIENGGGTSKAVKQTNKAAKRSQTKQEALIKKIKDVINGLAIPKKEKEEHIEKLNSLAATINTENSFCFGGDMSTNEFKDADVIIGDEDCGKDAPKCNTPAQVPIGFKSEVEYGTTYIKPGFQERNLCALYSGSGFTFVRCDGWIKLRDDKNHLIPMKDEFYSPYEIETCFNDNLEKYQFNLKTLNKNDNYLYINILTAVCDPFPKEIASLEQLSSIPDNEVCKALQDFELQRYYNSDQDANFWNENDVQYSITDAIYEHEKYHQRDATRLANKLYKERIFTVLDLDGYAYEKTLKEYLSTTFQCSKLIKNYSEAKNKIEENVKNALKGFMEMYQTQWGYRINATVQINFYGEKIYKIRELFTQWNDDVQNKISNYQETLISIKHFDINGCNIHLKDWSAFNIYKKDPEGAN